MGDILSDEPELAKAAIYMCASASMMESFAAGLLNLGVQRENIHYEHFGLGSTGGSGRYNINFRGQAVEFNGHRTLLDALEDTGVIIDADCRTGTCGRCQVKVTSGSISRLIDPEFKTPGGFELACCTTPTSDAAFE